jgi:hypothetical protein
MRAVPLIRRAGDVDAAWLSGVVGAEVAALWCDAIGTGQMGRTVRVRYDLAAGGGGSLVVKLASEDATSRATALAIGAYRREVEFYRAFGTLAAGAVPGCHGLAIDEAGEWFAIVLDDLAAARVGDQLAGCDTGEVSAALASLAALQGPMLGDPPAGSAAWLNQPRLAQALYQAVLPGFLERFGPRLAPEHVELCTWFGPRVDAWAADPPAPLGLVHGDLRADNLLFAGRHCTIVDWQTVAWGPAMRDVSYLLGGSLPPPVRREHDERLLREYVSALPGVAWADAWWAYRHQSLYGVLMAVVASMIVGATERGDEMFATMLGRHATHALDLGARELVPEPSGALVPAAGDEGWHDAGPEPLWNESYYLDCVSADGGTGVYVRLGRLPNLGRTHAVVSVVRRGGASVLLHDAAAPLPVGDGNGQRVEAASFRVDMAWSRPLAEFTVTARGVGVAHADPAAHLRGEAGAPAEVELDLTWHTDGVPYQWRVSTRYEIPCRVTGQVTVDGHTVRIDGVGQRDHSWGNRDWWQFDWCWSALHLSDGTHWHTVSVPDRPGVSVGYRQRGAALTELTAVHSVAEPTADGLFGTTVLRVEPGASELRATPVAFGPIRLEGDDGRLAYFPRALCEVSTADGRTGVGWLEWNRVQPPG